MHQRHQVGQHSGIGGRHHAVAEVEDVPGRPCGDGGPAVLDNGPRPGFHDVPAGHQHDGIEVALTVDDNKNFRLFTQGETAWAKDADTDKALVTAMRSGSRMVVKGTSTRGTLTTDTYSLSGFSRAYERASRECGVKI